MVVKTLKLRRADTCVVCQTTIDAGTTASWDSEAKAVTCMTCIGAEPSRVPAIDSGMAGASAAREYDRRARHELARKEKAVRQDAEWREAIKAERPFLGRVGSALTPRPAIGPESQSTKAWSVGAAGERRVGEILDGCDRVRALHDRRIPRSKANIDHIAIGPAGVYVIDAKLYEGRVEARDKGSWLRSDVRLYVAGRDRSKLLGGVERQIAVVRGVLEAAGMTVPVRGFLCFVGGEWPMLLRKPLQFGSVTALWPGALADRVVAPGPMDAAEIDSVTSALATALHPA